MIIDGMQMMERIEEIMDMDEIEIENPKTKMLPDRKNDFVGQMQSKTRMLFMDARASGSLSQVHNKAILFTTLVCVYR